MSDPTAEFLAAYDKYRVDDQAGFYEARIAEYSKADNQALVLGLALIFAASVCGILGAADIARIPLGITAAVLAALGAAVASWAELVGFRLNVETYTVGRASLGLLRPNKPGPGASTEEVRNYVAAAEDILLGEVRAWAQKWQRVAEEEED